MDEAPSHPCEESFELESTNLSDRGRTADGCHDTFISVLEWTALRSINIPHDIVRGGDSLLYRTGRERGHSGSVFSLDVSLVSGNENIGVLRQT